MDWDTRLRRAMFASVAMTGTPNYPDLPPEQVGNVPALAFPYDYALTVTGSNDPPYRPGTPPKDPESG
jgi:hypothetical protein